MNNKKQPKQKKIKDQDKTDRLIARMILGIGLSLTIANGVACGIIHPKFDDVRYKYWEAKENKDAYLATYKQSDEFKTSYHKDITELDNRLIAREIDAYTYESELEKLNDNTYTEQVLLANANEQTQAEFNEINQKYLTANDEWDKYALPCALTSYFSAVFPAFTLINYNVWVPKKKNDEDVAEEEIDDEHIPQIDPEVMKMVTQIKDTPYRPINAEDTSKSKIKIVHDEKLGVLRAVENQPNTAIPNVPRSVDACIIETEEETQENQKTI